MTTAWLDLRNRNTDDIAEIIEAAIENQIEAVITNCLLYTSDAADE